MKRANYYLLFFMLTGILLSACKDFIEPSLEHRTVQLNSPADSAETVQYAITFWWEPVADALSYHLQVATPDFSRPVSLVLDTLVSSLNSIKATLDPGSYQWRVRAENGSSASPYSTGSFTIHPSSLTDQKLSLAAPLNHYLTSESSIQLRWDALFGAKAYRLQIDTLDFADETKLVYNESLSGSSYLFSFPKDQVYQWRVRAENDTQQSRWSDTRLITYDHTAPGTVTPVAPVSGSSVNLPVVLSWTAVTGAKKYKLYVYKPDQVTAYTTSFPVLLTALSYSFNQGAIGETIYWRVSAIDEAGNEGEKSVLMNFLIQ